MRSNDECVFATDVDHPRARVLDVTSWHGGDEPAAAEAGVRGVQDRNAVQRVLCRDRRRIRPETGVDKGPVFIHVAPPREGAL